MALFDVRLHFLFQTEILEKAVNRGDVVVILVFGGFLRLWLDQDRALEADLVLVVDDLLQETARVGAFGLEIGVQQRLIPLAPAPQDVVLPAKFHRRVHVRLHGGGGIGVDVGVGVGGRARHPAAVRKEVRGAPQQFGFVAGLLVGEVIDNLVQIALGIGKGLPLRPRVGVVEAVERLAKDIEHLERHVGLEFRQRHGVAEPGAVKGLPAERVAAGPGEAVPVGHGKSQVIFHALAEDHLVGVVMAEGEFIGAGRPFKLDGGDAFEKIGHNRSLMAVCAARNRAWPASNAAERAEVGSI